MILFFSYKNTICIDFIGSKQFFNFQRSIAVIVYRIDYFEARDIIAK